MNNKNIEKLKPTGLFSNYIFKSIPLAFDESLSYYETLCGLLSYLKDTVIPTVNNNADVLTEIETQMNTLQSYVDNYFDNLDVQNEINTKLDEMVSDGTLDKIINQDIFNELNTKVNQNSEAINVLSNKKYIFFGDSYASGEIGSSWKDNIISYLGLTENDYYNGCVNGYGFTYPSSTQNWESVLDNLLTTITNKNEITNILVAGGYNDGAPYNSSSQQEIENAIGSFVNKCKTNFPNAKIQLAHIGWTGNMDNFAGLHKSIRAYKNCEKYGASYILNSEFSMHNYTLYQNDYFHPNEQGNIYNAIHLINGLINGSCDVYYEVPITLTSNTTLELKNVEVISITHNEISEIEFRNKDQNNMFMQSNGDNNITLQSYQPVNLFNIGNNLSTTYAGNNTYRSNSIMTMAYYIDSENNSGLIPLVVNVQNYKFEFTNIEANKTIKFLGIIPFTIKQLSLYC